MEQGTLGGRRKILGLRTDRRFFLAVTVFVAVLALVLGIGGAVFDAYYLSAHAMKACRLRLGVSERVGLNVLFLTRLALLPAIGMCAGAVSLGLAWLALRSIRFRFMRPLVAVAVIALTVVGPVALILHDRDVAGSTACIPTDGL
jgi:hypothetical protein